MLTAAQRDARLTYLTNEKLFPSTPLEVLDLAGVVMALYLEGRMSFQQYAQGLTQLEAEVSREKKRREKRRRG